MTLDDALKQLVAEFGEGAKADEPYAYENAIRSASAIEITSGGRKLKHSDPEPALYSSQELAVGNWLRSMRDFLIGSGVGIDRLDYKITSGPHLDKWMITVADKSGQHRVGEPRWSVTAKVWIGSV